MKNILTALVLMTTPTLAGPDRVSVLLGSAHIGGDGFDGRNPGLFLTWEDKGPFDLSAGIYHNSYGRISVAATAALPVVEWSTGEISLFAGAALYPVDGRNFAVHLGDVVPLGGLQVRQGDIFGQIIPGDGQYVDAIVSIGVTFPIK